MDSSNYVYNGVFSTVTNYHEKINNCVIKY